MSKINSVICIDVETGGLSPTKNPITQIAYQAFDLDTYKDILEFSTYVQPYNNLQYEPKAMEVTGITQQQLAKGMDTKSLIAKLQEDFAKANTSKSTYKKPILMGHNIGFDVGFITYLFNYCKVDIGKYLDCNENAHGEKIPKYIDTLALAKQKWANDPNMEKYNLAACIKMAGLDIFDAHSAMNDVRATKQLFFYFTNHLRTGTAVSKESKERRVRNHFRF